MKAESAKPREAAGPPGACQATAPGGSFWPANEPCLSLEDGPFHLKLGFFPPRLKLTAATLGPPVKSRLIWGSHSARLFHRKEDRSRTIWAGWQSVAKVGILALPLTSSKNWGQLLNPRVSTLSLWNGNYITSYFRVTGKIKQDKNKVGGTVPNGLPRWR